MRIRWTRAAAADLEETHDFLVENYPHLVPSTVAKLYDSIRSLKDSPHRGNSSWLPCRISPRIASKIKRSKCCTSITRRGNHLGRRQASLAAGDVMRSILRMTAARFRRPKSTGGPVSAHIRTVIKTLFIARPRRQQLISIPTALPFRA